MIKSFVFKVCSLKRPDLANSFPEYNMKEHTYKWFQILRKGQPLKLASYDNNGKSS